MTGSKKIFFRISSPLAGLFSLSGLRKLSGINRLVPVYHAVSDDPPAHLKYLYRIKSVKEFEADLDVLLKNYRPISLNELIEWVRKGEKVSEPVFHMTFDDGLSEFYQHAAPLLRKKGIPATCFLNNNFIDNADMMYRLKVSLLIDHLHHSEPGSKAWEGFHAWSREYGHEHRYYRKVLMELGIGDLHQIDALAAGAGISFSDYRQKNHPYMSSAQIRELIGQGFTFGAHSSEHRDFRQLDEQAQLEQVKESSHDLAKRFNLDYRVFSFPFTDFGIRASFFEEILKQDICSLSFGCAGIKKDAAPINIQRMPVEDYRAKFGSILKKEYLYYLFLKLSGRAMVKR